MGFFDGLVSVIRVLTPVWWVIFIVDSILLVLIVLVQSGRGGGLSGMLGGGGVAESALGPKTGLPKITGIMAAVFFVSAVLIGIARHEPTITPVKTHEETGTKEGVKPSTPAPPSPTSVPSAKPSSPAAGSTEAKP